ncbi:gamma-tubulin complex component 4-like [Hydractinia symbiolongicarpus]|uniref:gamma-tubulin complex component 4-like n=1 Tax=Hydractinia symbiolongicarpus TaxID=13093 RepID=UPI00254A3688|nr:gamma-tubulin complex component 4-like [Hydractinia symbiolongicarpus]XP_057306982.1 gamma-tubulin complex component 4-like [Hydractinia symbiolongicarpus]
MFHELLLALSGTPGAIFTVNKLDELQITKNLPFLHPSEVELLDKICKLGGFYRKFQNFIEKYSFDLSPVNNILSKKEHTDDAKLRGQYLHAFCAGLAAVLQPYQDCLVKIEKQVMKNPHIPLSFVYQDLEDYFFVFPVLANIVTTMEQKQIHGCQVLTLLQETGNCGIPTVKETLEKILHSCHSVLYKQLSAWMLHGILLDEYDEFFITDKTQQEIKRNIDEKDSAILSSNTILRGIAGLDLLEELQLVDDVANLAETQRIVIVSAMLPSYLPLRVAEKILFVGESVQMLKDTENLKIHHYNQKISNLLQGRETEFLQTLHKLQQEQYLSIPALEVEIDKIKSCVAEQLWRLVVEEADLIKHLKYLKEMYLLGRGELYLTFIDHAHNMMKGPPSNTVAYDINAAFKQSLAKILSYSDEYEALFEMMLDTVDNERDGGFLKTSWDYLKISYSPPWPLHLLFTPNVMEKYNTLFMFLLKVRRTQIELQNVWALQMSSKRSGKTKSIPSITWGLRRQMAFFIDNLQYYLQVDVLESQFTVLLEKIKKTHDFESIHTSLDFFLISMLMQSFISMKPVLSILLKVINICMSFCQLVSQSYTHWAQMENEKVKELSAEFNRQTVLLFKVLSSVRSHSTSPHLSQLLLRVDFNKYFTRTSSN